MDQITWLAGAREFGGSQMSMLDIEKIKASYGCPDKITEKCFLHLSEPMGTISSTDPGIQGCKVLITAPFGEVVLSTTKFMVMFQKVFFSKVTKSYL